MQSTVPFSPPPLLSGLHLNNSNSDCMTNEKLMTYILFQIIENSYLVLFRLTALASYLNILVDSV